MSSQFLQASRRKPNRSKAVLVAITNVNRDPFQALQQQTGPETRSTNPHLGNCVSVRLRHFRPSHLALRSLDHFYSHGQVLKTEMNSHTPLLSVFGACRFLSAAESFSPRCKLPLPSLAIHAVETSITPAAVISACADCQPLQLVHLPILQSFAGKSECYPKASRYRREWSAVAHRQSVVHERQQDFSNGDVLEWHGYAE
jgi:hypothetical protein